METRILEGEQRAVVKLPHESALLICLLGLTGLLVGCSVTFPRADGGLGELVQPAAPGPMASDAEILAEAVRATQQPPRWRTALSQAGSGLREALTLRPRRLAADDPVRLSDQPEQLDSNLYYSAARLHESKNNVNSAIMYYQQALQADPEDVRAMLGIARLFDRQSDMDRAEQHYREALQIEPENVVAMNDLALCLARQRKLDAARALFQQAVELDPENQRYRNNLATLLIEMGRPDDAFETLVAVHPRAVAHYNTAFLLARRGMVQPATAQLVLAMQADPSFQPARQLLRSLEGDSTLDPDGRASNSSRFRRLPPVG